MDNEIKVVGIVSHISGRPLTEAERTDERMSLRSGPMEGPDMHDRGLTARQTDDPRQGKMSVALRVGDELGDIDVGTLYVGYVDNKVHHKELEVNMSTQNDLMVRVHGWMADILGMLGVPFEAVIIGETPGDSPAPLALVEAAAQLDNSVTLDTRARSEVNVSPAASVHQHLK